MHETGRNAKACYRLAKTQMALENYNEAVETLEAILATEESDATKGQRKALQDLLTESKSHFGEEETDMTQDSSIKFDKRDVSIREFKIMKELGVGNFSEVHSCQHKKTGEIFALKIITKKRAAELAKRQHPNVYNEIQMERRTLLERLPPHDYIVRMYHAFQDYNSLYYLMDLYTENTDLWSMIRHKDKMVGVHRSLIKVYLAEILDALQHMHSHGIVHRDLKPENILLSDTGHVIVIDFGTAKDLIQTDLNGPEFVGTPDFMSPEAVQGVSGPDEEEKAEKEGRIGADHTADLWALGGVAFILFTGMTPFWSPSPYLTFLRIKRGNLYRPWGIADDDAWDLIHRLMHNTPEKRLGADCFQVTVGESGVRTMKQCEGGYDVIRNHPYFSESTKEECSVPNEEGSGSSSSQKSPNVFESTNNTTPIPSLADLCIPAIAELVRKDSLDLELCDAHPPGDGSSHDMLRLNPRDRKCVMHMLDRLQILSEPRVYRRFFSSQIDFRLDKIRKDTHDYVGLAQMNDNQGRFPNAGNDDPYAKPVELDPIKFVHLTNPLLVKHLNANCDQDTRKKWTKLLKKSIATINRTRPKVVVASGFVDDACRKLLARISDSIPVVVHGGSTFFSFWLCGAQGLMLRSGDLIGGDVQAAQMSWIREQLEQSRMSKHQVFAFVDCDPRQLPPSTMKRLARGRTSCILGSSQEEPFASEVEYRIHDGIDDASVRSTDSDEDEKDNYTTGILGTNENGLRWITIEEHGKWQNHFSSVKLPAA